jgi:hypothetical protein
MALKRNLQDEEITQDLILDSDCGACVSEDENISLHHNGIDSEEDSKADKGCTQWM